jgi:hypothetical protein
MRLIVALVRRVDTADWCTASKYNAHTGITSRQRSLQAENSSAQAMVSSGPQLGGGTASFEKGL